MSQAFARCLPSLNISPQVKLQPDNVNKLIQRALAIFKEEVIIRIHGKLQLRSRASSPPLSIPAMLSAFCSCRVLACPLFRTWYCRVHVV